jgi:phage tail tape-measure protein
MNADEEESTPKEPTEHPRAEDHGTSHLVRKEGVGGAVGTAVGAATGAAAGAVAGGFAGPAGMAIGALVGAAAGAAGGKAAGDPFNPELEKGEDAEERERNERTVAEAPQVGD